MDWAQRQQIEAITKDVKRALKTALLTSTGKMANLSARETIAKMIKMGYRFDDVDEAVKAVVLKKTEQYAENLNKGGSLCVDRVLTPTGDGRYIATTRELFVPWLDDSVKDMTDRIIDTIDKGTAQGKNPYVIAQELEEYLAETRHNAELVARTESQKMRSDAAFAVMEDNGVKYVMYKTAGDDRVRPEHAQRDGKIYRMEDAPYLGEYNCRCTCVPADRNVKKGAAVAESEEEIVNE